MCRLATLIFVAAAQLASAVQAETLPSGWQSHRFNGDNQPSVDNGIVTFQLFDRVCSDIDYGDGRGENDCVNGNVRSAIYPTGRQARLGDAVEYRFNLRIDPSFALAPFHNPEAIDLLPGGSDSRLRIASWEGPLLHNFIYLMKADAGNGVTFLGHQCQSPAAFGNWVSVSMTILWASDETGWIKLTCDDRLVYVDESVATNQAPHCYAANVCEPGKSKNPRSFQFLLGPVIGGYGQDYARYGFSSPFIEIQEGGILIQVRDMAVEAGGELYSDADRELVAQLQERLNALGCDVGAVDGRVGNRTRSRVIDCRYFGAGVALEKLTLATLPSFVERYGAPGVADLPREAPPSRIAAISAHSEVISNGDMLLNLKAIVDDSDDGPTSLDVILIGRFDERGVTQRLEVLFRDDLDPVPEALAKCSGVRVESWGDGTSHLVVGFSASETSLTPQGMGCVAEALPGPPATKVRTFVALLPEIAEALAAPATLRLVDNAGIRAFIVRVATGATIVATATS